MKQCKHCGEKVGRDHYCSRLLRVVSYDSSSDLVALLVMGSEGADHHSSGHKDCSCDNSSDCGGYGSGGGRD